MDDDDEHLMKAYSCQVRISDRGVLKKLLKETLSNEQIKISYIFVGDNIFSIQEYLTKACSPEQKRNFKHKHVCTIYKNIN